MERKIKRYIGKNTFCGSYAVLNAIDWEIDAELFELSAGIPFGVKCVDMKSERLLTPFCNPNEGMDEAMKIWGIPFDKFVSAQKDIAFKQLCYELDHGRNIVLGPLNMGKLFYIPLCGLYEGVDHYICLQKIENNVFLIRDSEGYISAPITKEELYKMWNVNQVYEANGKFTFRSFVPQKMLSKFPFNYPEHIIKLILKQMKRNLMQAEKCGQGSQAFANAFEFLKAYNINKWKLSFLYELEYLIQRKMMVLYFFEELVGEECVRVEILKDQIYLIAQIYRKIKGQDKVEKEKLLQLGKLEKQLVK